ncbi:MAG: DUF1799 domain-containing protein [Acidobacteria bacterium]|nr:DUF1799 domain-containing protein [Acidobacteriota bacterium]
MPQERDFDVLPENWDTVLAFFAAQTQWRHGPDGRLVGLDYAGVRAAVRGLVADGCGERRQGRRLKWRSVFSGLRVMEAAVLEELGKR